MGMKMELRTAMDCGACGRPLGDADANRVTVDLFGCVEKGCCPVCFAELAEEERLEVYNRYADEIVEWEDHPEPWRCPGCRVEKLQVKNVSVPGGNPPEILRDTHVQHWTRCPDCGLRWLTRYGSPQYSIVGNEGEKDA